MQRLFLLLLLFWTSDLTGFLFHMQHPDSQKVIENGIITQMRADWILPDDKKLEVTLKILNMDKHLTVSRLRHSNCSLSKCSFSVTVVRNL